MDPMACWERLAAAAQDGDMEEAADAARDLREWSEGGGYKPADVPADVWDGLRDFERLARRTARHLLRN